MQVNKEVVIEKRRKLVEAIAAAKADERLQKAFKEYYTSDYIDTAFGYLNEICDKIVQNDNGDFLAFSEERTGAVGFNKTPVEVTHIADTTEEVAPARIRTKLGKYIRNRLGISTEALADHMLQKFCNIVVAAEHGDKDLIELVTGKDITEAYKEGFGSSSCMCGSMSYLTKVYAINPERIALLKYYGETPARALVWTTNSGKKYIDRIYPEYGEHTEVIYAWAAKNNMLVRGIADYEKIRKQKVTINALDEDEYYPYLDTFCYADYAVIDGSIDYDKITLSPNSSFGQFVLQSAEGCTLEGDNHNCCANCGDHISEDDTWYAFGNHYCRNCFDNYYFECYKCGEIYSDNDSVSTEDGYTYCPECAGEYTITCAECGEIYRISKNNYVGTQYGILCQSCACCSECGESCTEEEIEKDSTCDNFIVRCDKCRAINEELGKEEKSSYTPNPNQVELNIPATQLDTQTHDKETATEFSSFVFPHLGWLPPKVVACRNINEPPF